MPGLVPGIMPASLGITMTAAYNKKSRLRKRRGRVTRTLIATARILMARRPSSRKKPKATKRKAAAKAARASPPAKPPAKGQWVYIFGGGKAQGRSGMKDLLGGKGANLAEMANLGLPVPPGFTITTAVCTHYYANAKKYPKDLEKQVDAGPRPHRPHHRAAVRRPRQSAARVGALRRPRLDAGHDGHRAQPRPQRRHRRGAGAAVRRPALRLRFLPPLHPDVFQRRARHRASQLRGHSGGPQVARGLHARHRTDRRRLGRRGGALPGARARGEGRAVPAGPARAALGRDRRGVRLVDERARHHLSPPARHSGKLGHRGQRAGHGVRQHGRHLGDRRRLHPQSVDRREAALRRVPDQRPGRGRRRRHPHAAGDHRDRAEGGRLRQAVDGKRDAGGVQGADPHLRRAREALPRHAGHGVHRRAGQALDAADPERQAHREGRAPHRGRACQREADHAETRRWRGSSPARSTSCCIRPSIRRPSAT